MILGIVSIFLLILFYYFYKKSIKHKAFFKFSLYSLLIILGLEFTVFNFRSYESLFNKEIKAPTYTLGEGLEMGSDGYIRVVGDKLNYIDITGINAHLNNIYMDFDFFRNSGEILYVSVGYTDNANRYYSYAQEQVISANNQKDGEVMKLHLSGKTRRIRLYVKTHEEKDAFKVSEIVFNKKVPFTFSSLRVFSILAFVLVLYIFRPKSSIYKRDLFKKENRKFIFIAVGIQILLLICVSQFNYYFVKEKFETNQRFQYQLLTEAFLKGQTYLDIEPSPVFDLIRNPYDKKERIKAFENYYGDEFTEANDYFIWDAAYFNNRYYVYFGVAPVITYYLPYYVLTGHHITTVNAIIITMIATVIGIFLLLYQICKKWFKNVSLGVYLALGITFVTSCGILFIMGRPDHYSLPILMGIMFSIYGLYWWFKAVFSDMKARYLFLGSLCMAAVAACRPQLLLTSFFALPIFWDKVFKSRELFSKNSIKKTIALVTPYVVIGLLLMAYNYARFGSPFDFGANYNLTTNDMTKRGFVFDRIPLGIYYYLFKPLNLTLRFPFVMRDRVVTNYLGTTIYEDMGAGFIFANILVIYGLLIFKFKDKFKDKLPYKIGAMAVIFSIIIIIADTQMAGILPRYICDFGFLLYLATCIVLFYKFNQEHDKNLIKLLYACFIFAIIYNSLLLFSDSVLNRSELFFYIRHLFQFWI